MVGCHRPCARVLLPSNDPTDADDRDDEVADERTGDIEGNGDEDDEDFLSNFPDETNVSSGSSPRSCHNYCLRVSRIWNSNIYGSRR